MARRKDDFYPTTDDDAIAKLLKHWDIFEDSEIFECCSGEGHLVKQLELQSYRHVWRGDINSTSHYFDATNPDDWKPYKGIEYVITNPPFNKVMEILPLAKDFSKYGVAMLLGLNFLEPCKNRVDWLIDNPISKIISIPRMSFTGDGKKAPRSTAWFVWDKQCNKQEIIIER